MAAHTEETIDAIGALRQFQDATRENPVVGPVDDQVRSGTYLNMYSGENGFEVKLMEDSEISDILMRIFELVQNLTEIKFAVFYYAENDSTTTRFVNGLVKRDGSISGTFYTNPEWIAPGYVHMSGRLIDDILYINHSVAKTRYCDCGCDMKSDELSSKCDLSRRLENILDVYVRPLVPGQFIKVSRINTGAGAGIAEQKKN